jgi:hypothetical protein
MSLGVVDQEKLRTICALLEEQGVSGSVIEDFKRGLKESDLLRGDKRDIKNVDPLVLGAAALKSPDALRHTALATPTRRTNTSPSLSPIHLQRQSLPPSSSSSPSSNLRHACRDAQDTRECFDHAPPVIDYDWVATQNFERKSHVQKLLRSPRPPTSKDATRPSPAASDVNFDAFSEYDPKRKFGLNQLYIPPPSPKASLRSNAAALSNLSSDSMYSTQLSSAYASSPGRGTLSPAVVARRSAPCANSAAAEERFDYFLGQEYPGSGIVRHAGPRQREKF